MTSNRTYENVYGLTVARAETLALDTASPWYVVCEIHSQLLAVDSKRSGMTVHGSEFCEDCRAVWGDETTLPDWTESHLRLYRNAQGAARVQRETDLISSDLTVITHGAVSVAPAQNASEPVTAMTQSEADMFAGGATMSEFYAAVREGRLVIHGPHAQSIHRAAERDTEDAAQTTQSTRVEGPAVEHRPCGLCGQYRPVAEWCFEQPQEDSDPGQYAVCAQCVAEGNIPNGGVPQITDDVFTLTVKLSDDDAPTERGEMIAELLREAAFQIEGLATEVGDSGSVWLERSSAALGRWTVSTQAR